MFVLLTAVEGGGVVSRSFTTVCVLFENALLRVAAAVIHPPNTHFSTLHDQNCIKYLFYYFMHVHL